jgi:hypothetical protein
VVPPTSADNTPLIVGVVVGSLLFLAVVALVVFLLKRRRARKPLAKKPAAAEMKPQPQSNYAAINVAPAPDYNRGRLDSNDDQPAPSNYAVIPAKSSDYDNGRMNVDGAAAASEYNVGRLS